MSHKKGYTDYCLWQERENIAKEEEEVGQEKVAFMLVQFIFCSRSRWLLSRAYYFSLL
jgi:hypothetical protein